MTSPRSYPRDKVTGRFITMTPDDLVPENVSGTDVRPGMEVPRHAPDADLVAQGGQQRWLQPRTATLVADEAEVRARARYGVQGVLTRLAARMHTGPMDPIRYITGASDD